MRGKAARDGDTMVSANGYHYTKVDGKWKLTHHIVAEEMLGRSLHASERVIFINDKTDLSPENIRVVKKGKQTLQKRLAQLEARRDEINNEINGIKAEILMQENQETVDNLEASVTKLQAALNI